MIKLCRSIPPPEIPDYDLDDMVVVTAPVQLRALSDDLRGSLLELVLERAATVTELAQAVGRPKSTVAYHVNLLVDAGLFKVVRTQRVRAIEERYYGRVARTIYIGALQLGQGRRDDRQHRRHRDGVLRVAPRQGGRRPPLHPRPRPHPGQGRACLLGRGPGCRPQVRPDPRSGDQVYGFVAGLYPTDAPTLPER